MQGQANWFRVLAPDKIVYAIHRDTKETKRLYGVLNTHLEITGKPYLIGDKCTIAEIANWNEFLALKAWEERMYQRPVVENGRHVPEPHHREMFKSAEAKAAAERKAFDTVRDLRDKGLHE
ncbi:hypothetical protein LTR36_006610 [Oleoguttula mirabilis]|uniref:Uncharacterized protein n=1 Tax=Oleoguttula mirabilis TaxID=1507867 RepID=A0AAV9JCM7_9PEZI|nr:hypothetical protein LTR36_006610 [Oleoguttula mirabilis]